MINRCMDQLMDELRADDVADPLRERFLLAAVWDDLCRLAGETPPPHVRRVLEASGQADNSPSQPTVTALSIADTPRPGAQSRGGDRGYRATK